MDRSSASVFGVWSLLESGRRSADREQGTRERDGGDTYQGWRPGLPHPRLQQQVPVVSAGESCTTRSPAPVPGQLACRRQPSTQPAAQLAAGRGRRPRLRAPLASVERSALCWAAPGPLVSSMACRFPFCAWGCARQDPRPRTPPDLHTNPHCNGRVPVVTNVSR